jgi:hypothetical protein
LISLWARKGPKRHQRWSIRSVLLAILQVAIGIIVFEFVSINLQASSVSYAIYEARKELTHQQKEC